MERSLQPAQPSPALGRPGICPGIFLVKRSLLLLTICLWAGGLAAQILPEELNPELLLEELAELSNDELWEEQAEHKLAIAARYQEAALKGQFYHSKGEWQLYGNIRYRETKPHYKYQLRYKDTLCLGNYRAAWGEGLIFAKATGSEALLAPAAAQTYNPLGAALGLGYKALRLDLGASEQYRQARLSDGYISALPVSAGTSLSQSREKLHYAALSYGGEFLKLGAIYYRQEYDKAFAPSLGDSLLSVLGSSLALGSGQHQLRAECIWQKEPSYVLNWELQQERFTQKWSYKRLGHYQKPAYAARVNRLINAPQREEIATRFGYLFSPRLRCELQATLNSARGQISAKSWQSEEIIRVRYNMGESRFELQMLSIDRDILAVLDSLYRKSKAQHQRLNIRFSHKVAERLRLNWAFRYQYQEESQKLLQGIWWEQKLSYQAPRLHASLGYNIWNSGKYPLYILAEKEQEYQSYAAASAALKLSGSYTWRGFCLGGSLQQDIKDPHAHQYSVFWQYKSK